jgi:DNA-binding SARP family transcriptional activator
MLTQALALWRGPALADVLYQPFAGTPARQLEERRLDALESRIGAELDCGGGAALVPELEQLVADYPLRERLVAALMLALVPSGQAGGCPGGVPGGAWPAGGRAWPGARAAGVRAGAADPAA